MIFGHPANVVIAGTPYVVTYVQVVPDATHVTPGQVLAQRDNSWTVVVADGAVTVVVAAGV
jgi:hypothetical protein